MLTKEAFSHNPNSQTHTHIHTRTLAPAHVQQELPARQLDTGVRDRAQQHAGRAVVDKCQAVPVSHHAALQDPLRG